ncbi:hypothetical protein [Mucilaginibacter sp.]|uniref:hypothetical protein n=1 Tax=Mucilaginibacter sp. TaxID=1882438 RepID=UPI003D142548
MFKKRNAISKLWLKFTDKPKYKEYKYDFVNYKQFQFTASLTGRVNSIDKIKAITDVNHQLNLIHSGNAGDIIYALPTLKKIHELTGAAINLYFRLGRPMDLPLYSTHPLGNVMLNQKMADMLFPLIRSQAYIDSCEIYTDQKIDVDLDYFRSGLIPMNKGNIARWCGYVTGVSADLYKSWLSVEPDKTFADTILIARSGRYQNTEIDHSFISKYPKLAFIGVESEYNDIKKYLPNIQWIQMNDFLQMAQTIAGCKFFIGNQSFPYSIAEALKVPRILEVAFDVINVVPEGENGYDFFFQDHFEWLVAHLNGDK